jgi:hypothetical protein
MGYEYPSSVSTLSVKFSAKVGNVYSIHRHPSDVGLELRKFSYPDLEDWEKRGDDSDPSYYTRYHAASSDIAGYAMVDMIMALFEHWTLVAFNLFTAET